MQVRDSRSLTWFWLLLSQATKWYLIPIYLYCAFLAFAIFWQYDAAGDAADFAEIEVKVERGIPKDLTPLPNLGRIRWLTSQRIMFGATWILRGEGVVEPAKFIEWTGFQKTGGKRVDWSDQCVWPHVPDAPVRFPPVLIEGNFNPGRYWEVSYRDERTQLWVKICLDTLTGTFGFSICNG